jgi:hypothetical protein
MTRFFQKMKTPYILVVFMCIFTFNSIAAGQIFDQSDSNSFTDKFQNWDFGSGIGFNSKGPGGTVFAEVFTADWRFTDKISIGPMIQLVPPGDYTMVAGALVGRYKMDIGIPRLSVMPLLGLGGLHSEVKNTGVSNQASNKDTSYYATLGISLDWGLSDHFGLTASYLYNFHDIRTIDSRDRGSQSLFFGVRLTPTKK